MIFCWRRNKCAADISFLSITSSHPAIDSAMTAFDYLSEVGVALGTGEDFVVAIGSSSCGDTSEGELEKGCCWE